MGVTSQYSLLQGVNVFISFHRVASRKGHCENDPLIENAPNFIKSNVPIIFSLQDV
jgi:hypothetical protein